MADFEISLQAKLDEKSLESINAEIKSLQDKLNKIDIKAEIDPKVISGIENRIKVLEKTAAKIQIDADTSKATAAMNNTVKQSGKIGQQIADNMNKSVQQSLNIDMVIDKQVENIMSTFGIAGKKGSIAFGEIRKAFMKYRNELSSSNVNMRADDFMNPDDLFGSFADSSNIDNIINAIAKYVKEVDHAKEVYGQLADYIKSTNKSGNKIHLPESIAKEYGDSFSAMRSSLGSAFTTGNGTDFESYITELNGELGNLIDLSHGAEYAFGDLVEKVKMGRGSKYYSTEELFDTGFLNRSEIENAITDAIEIINSEEQKFAQQSTSAADTFVQNEQRKQQAVQETSDAITKAQSTINSSASFTGSEKSIISDFKDSLKNIGLDDSGIDTIISKIKSYNVEIKTLSESMSANKKNGKDTLSVDVSGIDQYGQTIKLTEQWTVENSKLADSLNEVYAVQQKTASGITAFEKQQSKAVTSATNRLEEMYRGAIDPSASKPIKEDDHLNNLANKYNEISVAIEKMGVASSSTFSDEQNTVSRLTSELKIMIREYQNAETAATDFRAKDLDTIKSQYSSKLDNLVTKMQSSGLYTPGFEKGAENLRNMLNMSVDASGLTAFLNGLDKLDAGYKRAIASAKAFSDAQVLSSNVDKLRLSISNFQDLNPNVSSFEAEIRGANVSVESLLDSLSKVKTAADFKIISADFSAFKEAYKGVEQEHKEQQRLIDAMAKGREQSELSRQASERQQEIEQAKAINKALEDEYKERQQLAEAMASGREKAQLTRETSDAKQSELQIKEAQSYANTLLQTYQKMSDLQVKKAGLETSTSKDIQAIKDLEAEMDNLKAKYVEVWNEAIKNPSFDRSAVATEESIIDAATKDRIADVTSINQVKAAYEELFSLASQVGKTEIDLFKLDPNKNVAEIDELTAKLEQLKARYDEVYGSLLASGNDLSPAQFETLGKILENTEQKLSELRAQFKDKIDVGIDTGKFEGQLTSVENKMRQFSVESDDLKGKTAELREAFDIMSSPDRSIDEKIVAYRQFSAVLPSVESELRQLGESYRLTAAEQNTLTRSQTLSNNIQTWMNENQKAAEKYGETLKQLQTQLNGNTDQKVEQQARLSFNNIKSESRMLGLVDNSMVKSLKNTALYMTGFGSMFQSINTVVREVKNGVSSITALDTALVDLQKTAKMTAQELESFYFSSNDVAKQMGVSTEEIINQAAAWSRLGYSTNEQATQMAKYSSMFAQISPGMDIDKATDGLVSAMKAKQYMPLCTEMCIVKIFNCR